VNVSFTSSEKAKSSLLLASIQDSKAKIISNIPKELLQKEKQLKIDLTYLEKNIQKEESKKNGKNEEGLRKWQNKFFNFHQEYLELLEQLETDYPDYYQLKYDTKTVIPAILQSVLQENQVVVSYFVGEEKLYIFVVTPDEFEVVDFQKPTDFDALVEGFMESLTQHQFEFFTQKGHQLHQLLIAPIQDFIVDPFAIEEEEELKQVFVIPHGILAYIPFEALIGNEPLSNFSSLGDSNDKNYSELDYLINHCEISYHYSATLLYRHLITKQTKEEIPNSFAGFAPIYDQVLPSKPTTTLEKSTKKIGTWATGSNAIHRDGTWMHLPHSETEAKEIAKLFDNKGFKAETFLRGKATKEGFAAVAKRFKFLLIAAHGLVNDQKTALSGLVFYPELEKQEVGSKKRDITVDSSVSTFHSSLPTSQVDNVLSMEETHHLELQADLAVLSSCESGIGTLHKGEGMMAVNRGFLAAGTNNVVSTLFKVYDKPSSLLTQYFFEAILNSPPRNLGGQEYSTALRLAKLRLMQQPNIDPKSWSGFILIGG